MSGQSLEALGVVLGSRSKDIAGMHAYRRTLTQWLLDFFDKLRGKEGTKIAHELRDALAISDSSKRTSKLNDTLNKFEKWAKKYPGLEKELVKYLISNGKLSSCHDSTSLEGVEKLRSLFKGLKLM